MNLHWVEKKVREAEFFLDLMRRREKEVVGLPEEFDFYLSAFLNAARGVDYRLRHEQKDAYQPWRTKWDLALAPDDLSLIKFLVDDRNLEVHESGSKRDETLSTFGVHVEGSTFRFVPIGAPRPGAIVKTDYSYGTQKVTDLCAKYIGLLRGMVEAFKADHQ